MNPLSYENFEKQSLIELVVLPHMNYLDYISELIYKTNHLIILDTQGTLNFKFGSNKWMENEDLETNKCKLDRTNIISSQKRIDYSYIFSVNDLFDKLEKLRNYKDFILILDSVTFIGDKSPNSIKNLCKAIWTLIYESNSTVIVINHFRIGKEKRTYKLVPRMGVLWEKAISYRIKFSYKNNKICYIIETL